MTSHHNPAAPPAPPPEPKDLPPVRSWAYPFATSNGKNPPDAQDYLQALANAGDGFYPLGANGLWHGGIHFDVQTGGMLKQGDGVRAIADGEVIAYRLNEKYPELDYSDGRHARYSSGFVLVHHKLALPPLPAAPNTNTTSNPPPKPPPPDEVLDFYSLYMHQLDWAGYKEAEKTAPPATDPAKPSTPTVQRMPFWQGNACFRVGSKAKNSQLPPSTPSAPAAPGATPGANAPLLVGQRVREKANGKILGLLPRGSELTVAATSVAGWGTIASITAGALVPYRQGDTLPPEASSGWIFLEELDSLIDPSPLDDVVVLPKPFRVKAGDLLGYVGQYVRHGDTAGLPAASTSRPLLHLEVFAGDAFPAFLAKSRERASKLPDSQKTLLVISPGATLVDVAKASAQTVGNNVTLVPVAGNPGSGRWTKVQPTKIVTTQPTHLHPKATTTRTPDGKAFWVEHDQSGTVVSGTVQGWAEFPLQPSNTTIATTSFMDVFTPAELTRLDAEDKAVDDKGIKWWKIEVGTGTGTSGSGWVCGTGHFQSPWAWPGFEVVDGTTVQTADMFKRSIHVNGHALPEEETSFLASAVTVNSSELFTKLEKAIDLDGNGTVTAQELIKAHSTSWLAEALSHLIVRYQSEWGGDTAKWAALTPIMKERAPIWSDELQRIENLQWWDAVHAADNDFPQSAVVHHFHPIGLIGNFIDDGCDCATQFKKISRVILNHEGGFVDRASDKGGPTNHGVAWVTWQTYAKEDLGVEPTLENLKALTEAQAEVIYLKRYWEPKGFCKFKNERLALMVYDWTITSGGAAKQIQKMLNQKYNAGVSEDGGMGPQTVDALVEVPDQDKLLEDITALRKDYYNQLVANDPSQIVNLKGWLNRVNDCLTVSI
jgi:lysozyme family protein